MKLVGADIVVEFIPHICWIENVDVLIDKLKETTDTLIINYVKLNNVLLVICNSPVEEFICIGEVILSDYPFL